MYTIYTVLALCTVFGLFLDVNCCGFGQFGHLFMRICRGIACGAMYGAVLGCLAAYGVAYLLPTHIVTSRPVPVVSMTPIDQSHPFVLANSVGNGMTVATRCAGAAACQAEVSAPSPALIIVAPDPSLAPDAAFWTTSNQEFDVSSALRSWVIDPLGSFEHPVVQYFRVPVGTQTGS